MFEFYNLFAFIQLIAGINFTPTFITSLRENYFSPFLTLSDRYRQSLINDFDLLKKYHSLNSSATQESYAKNLDNETEIGELKRLISKSENRRMSKIESKQALLLTEFIDQSERLNINFNAIISSDYKKIGASFLLSGLFSLSLLLFLPLTELFCGFVCESILYLNISLLFIPQILFQFWIFFKKSDNFTKIIIAFILSTLAIYVYSIFSNPFQFYKCSHHFMNWYRIVITFSIFLTLFSYILYTTKYSFYFSVNRYRIWRLFKSTQESIKDLGSD